MIDQLKEWDEELLLFLNQFHADWLDPIIFQLTKTEVWIPLYAVLIYLIIKNYKNKSWIVLVGIAISILLTDRITSGFMKPFFHRLRPSNEPALQNVLHTVNGYHGGLYGFASSHAANTMGVAFFLFLLFRSRYKWIGLIFIWAFIMSYTRIYLGVHYPGDIFVGLLVGLISGFLAYRLYLWIESKTQKKSPEKLPEI